MAKAQEVCRRGLAAIGGKPLAPLSFCWVPHREAWPLPSLRDAPGAFWAEGCLPGTVKSGLATLTAIARWRLAIGFSFLRHTEVATNVHQQTMVE